MPNIHQDKLPTALQNALHRGYKGLATMFRSLSSFRPGERLATPHFLEVDRLALRPIFNVNQWVFELLASGREFEDLLQPSDHPYWLSYVVTETGIRLSVFETTMVGPGVQPRNVFRPEEGYRGFQVERRRDDDTVRWSESGTSFSDIARLINPYEPVFCFEHEFDVDELRELKPQIIGIIRMQD